MQALFPKKLPRVGMRIVKTLVSCLAVALVYQYLLGGRNPCFACIGAVYGMGNQFQEGFKNGFNRFVGTLFGGLLVIPFYWLYYNDPLGIPESIYLVAGLFCVIYVNLLFGANNAIQPGTVVYFVVMFTQPMEGYVSYTLARIVDTGIGAIFSLVISMIHPSELDRIHGFRLRDTLHIWRRSNERPKAAASEQKTKA